jgi:hypothetical protein
VPKNTPSSTEKWIAILRVRDGNDCRLCSLPMWFDSPKYKRVHDTGKVFFCMESSVGATLDHIVPVVYGGVRTEENLRLVHRYCNNRRGDGRDAWQWNRDRFHRRKVVAELLTMRLITQVMLGRRLLVAVAHGFGEAA